MPKHIQKSLQDYLSKIKKPTPNIKFSSNSFLSSKNWILKGCRHTKTLSFAIERNQKHDNNEDDKEHAATLSDIDRFLFENFKSLYIKDDEHEKEKKLNAEGHDHAHHHQPQTPSSGATLIESPRFMDMPSGLCGSHRFFVVPDGLSSSLIEEAGRSSSMTTTTMSVGSGRTTSISTNNNIPTENNNVTIPDDCITVLKYSPNPHDDFQQSMKEMVESRLQQHKRVDWDFMEELLFCYLNLNDKKSYKFILSAFVDLIVILRQNEDKAQTRSRSFRIERDQRRRRRSMRHVT